MKKIYLLLFLCVASVSCNEWFDMTPDGTSIPEDRFFRNENVFLNALTDVYTQLRAESLYGRMLSVGELEFMGQNFQPAGTDFRAISTTPMRFSARPSNRRSWICTRPLRPATT